MVFGVGEDFDQVKLRLGVVADSDNGARNELGRRVGRGAAVVDLSWRRRGGC